jgi:hypothetical protein
MDAILARILAVPLDFPIQIRNGESVRQGQAAIAFEARDDVARRCIHVWTAAMACELELLTVLATAIITVFAASLPPCRVDAAKMQRTITPEYMCQGCDWRRILTVIRSSPETFSVSSSFPKAFTENGHVGSRNISKRGPGPKPKVQLSKLLSDSLSSFCPKQG